MSTSSFLQRYQILNKIGEGSFSEVLKCKDTKCGIFLAAKRLKKRFNSVEEVFGTAEIIAMQKLPRHPNILYMTEFHFDNVLGKVTFLFELMDLSLYDFINTRNSKPVPEPRAKYYLYQILCGIDHLHNNGIFHRDIKPENILLKLPPPDEINDKVKYETVKLGDLGSIRGIYSSPPFTEYISTRWYRSPECLLTAGYYGAKMDVWATGCVFYELLTFRPLFAGSNEVDQLSKIHNILGTPSSRILSKFMNNKSCNYDYFPKKNGTGLATILPLLSTEGLQVIKMMVAYDPDVRSNVKRLLEHKYFNPFRNTKEKALLQRGRRNSNAPIGDFKSHRKITFKKSANVNVNEVKDSPKLKPNVESTIIMKPVEKTSNSNKNNGKPSQIPVSIPVINKTSKTSNPATKNKEKSLNYKDSKLPVLQPKRRIHYKGKEPIINIPEPKISIRTKQNKTAGDLYKDTKELSYKKLIHTSPTNKITKPKKEPDIYRNIIIRSQKSVKLSPVKPKSTIIKPFVPLKPLGKHFDSKAEPSPGEIFINAKTRVIASKSRTSKFTDKLKKY